jgi:hypothetical protein
MATVIGSVEGASSSEDDAHATDVVSSEIVNRTLVDELFMPPVSGGKRESKWAQRDDNLSNGGAQQDILPDGLALGMPVFIEHRVVVGNEHDAKTRRLSSSSTDDRSCRR